MRCTANSTGRPRKTSNKSPLWIALAAGVLASELLASGSAVVQAVRERDAARVRTLIQQKVDVSAADATGETPLHWAAHLSEIEIVQLLLRGGAKANVKNVYGVTPLALACVNAHPGIVEALLKSGADPNIASVSEETPLMIAARTGNVDVVKALVEARAALDAHEKTGQTALMWAAAEGHADVVTLLLASGADPDRRARLTTIDERKHGDHPTGGFTALMFAARNGHGAAATALIRGGADPKLTNGDGLTATMIAIANDWFDLAGMLIDLGADPNDGSLYFAVDMHDATTDMRAHDGSRLRVDHPNTLTALDLIELLLNRGADSNKPFTGQVHSTTLCCAPEVNSSPFYRAAIASDVEVLKLMLAHGARVEWSPSEVKKEGAAGGAGRGMNANVGKTPIMMAMVGGRGAPFAAGPGFSRVTPPPFRELSSRDPVVAVGVLLAAGANPNVKAPDGSTPLHQAVQARQVPIIRALVAGGAALDATNKENLTPLQLAEKPEPAGRGAANADPDAYQVKRNTREEVIAALRELMKLGPNDPTPVPPPAPADAKSGDPVKATQ